MPKLHRPKFLKNKKSTKENATTNDQVLYLQGEIYKLSFYFQYGFKIG